MARKNQTEIISEALAVLRDGGLILYPTDTVWGIGCDATNPAAVAKVFALKRRPDSKSLVLLASDLDMVARYIKVIPPIAVDLVEVNDRPKYEGERRHLFSLDTHALQPFSHRCISYTN